MGKYLKHSYFIAIICILCATTATSCELDKQAYRRIMAERDSLVMQEMMTQDSLLNLRILQLDDSALALCVDSYGKRLLMSDKTSRLWELNRCDEALALASEIANLSGGAEPAIFQMAMYWLNDNTDPTYYYAHQALRILDKKQNEASDNNELNYCLSQKIGVYIVLNDSAKAKEMYRQFNKLFGIEVNDDEEEIFRSTIEDMMQMKAKYQQWPRARSGR